MNTYSKIADGLASWLNFEKRTKRESLFSEYYLAQPLGQLLQAHFGTSVQAEVEHPVLSATHLSPGRKPSIDFVVSNANGGFELAIETKWVSSSTTLMRDIIRDVVRLDLLTPQFAQKALRVVAGKKRDFTELFANRYFEPHPQHLSSNYLLPLGNHTTASVRFVPIPKFRQELFEKVLEIYKDQTISCSIPMTRSGPFPRNPNSDQYEVYIWRIRKYEPVAKFKPSEIYFKT